MVADHPPRTHLVLLVDDDLRTSRRLADMLREDGLAVEIARDGALAVARFTRAPVPDALVTELTTAHVDAASISRFARTRRPGLPVLIVTGYPNLFQPEAFGAEGPLLLFTKPVDYSTFTEALRTAVAEHPNTAQESGAATAPPELQSRVIDATTLAGNTLSGAQALRALRRS